MDIRFATLKQNGLNQEATQLKSGAAIQRLCVLALSATVRLLQLPEGVKMSLNQQQSSSVMPSSIASQSLHPHLMVA
jgi:hypothetical protein